VTAVAERKLSAEDTAKISVGVGIDMIAELQAGSRGGGNKTKTKLRPFLV
jgi:hypothetical protein